MSDGWEVKPMVPGPGLTAVSNTMTALKPCPFCGGSAVLEVIPAHTHEIVTYMPDYGGGAFIECNDCGVVIGDKTQAEVTATWNRRAAVELEKYLTPPQECYEKYGVDLADCAARKSRDGCYDCVCLIEA